MSRDRDYAADVLAAARLALTYAEGVVYEKFTADTGRMPSCESS